MEYRRPSTEGELIDLGKILAYAFVGSEEMGRTWIRDAGEHEARVLVRDGEIVAGFLRRPMGQWWGGRSVPMLGVAAVGTAPHSRGTGVATTLMKEAVREMHADGFPISTLFAASHPLYRRVGYELAGHVQRISVELVPLAGDSELPMRRMREEDTAAVRALQAEVVRERNGPLDRSEFIWKRELVVDELPCEGHVVAVDGRIDGYVTHLQRRDGKDLVLRVRDLIARNEAAGRRLLGFLAQHKAQVERATWNGDVADPMVTLLNTRRYRAELLDHWMLRIVDVTRAFEARGYPDGVRAILHFEIADELIEANSGRWTLEVEGGRGTVTPGGDGSLRASMRGLAPLYAGFLPATSLRRAGWIEADDETCALAASVFGGYAPYMSEQF